MASEEPKTTEGEQATPTKDATSGQGSPKGSPKTSPAAKSAGKQMRADAPAFETPQPGGKQMRATAPVWEPGKGAGADTSPSGGGVDALTPLKFAAADKESVEKVHSMYKGLLNAKGNDYDQTLKLVKKRDDDLKNARAKVEGLEKEVRMLQMHLGHPVADPAVAALSGYPQIPPIHSPAAYYQNGGQMAY